MSRLHAWLPCRYRADVLSAYCLWDNYYQHCMHIASCLRLARDCPSVEHPSNPSAHFDQEFTLSCLALLRLAQVELVDKKSRVVGQVSFIASGPGVRAVGTGTTGEGGTDTMTGAAFRTSGGEFVSSCGGWLLQLLLLQQSFFWRFWVGLLRTLRS